VRGPTPEIFRAIAWGRSNVLSETVARLRRSGTRYALAPHGTMSIALATSRCSPRISTNISRG